MTFRRRPTEPKAREPLEGSCAFRFRMWLEKATCFDRSDSTVETNAPQHEADKSCLLTVEYSQCAAYFLVSNWPGTQGVLKANRVGRAMRHSPIFPCCGRLRTGR